MCLEKGSLRGEGVSMNHPLHSFFRMVQQSRATLYQVPVYSIRYLEWLVDVPLLMILGKDERPGC